MPEQNKIISQWQQVIEIVKALDNGKITFKFQNGVPVYIIEADGKIERKELKRIE